MAATESRIRLVFDGVERGVAAAAKKSEAAVRGLNDENSRLAKSSDAAGKGLMTVGAGLAKVGAAGNVLSAGLSAGGGAVGALQALAPAALLLPGALLAGAAAMQTFKLATAGFGEAVGAGLSGDMEAFAEATKDMHPEMAKAAKTVADFKPRVDALKKSVQGRFWDQFSVGIKESGTNLLDMADKSLPALSGELGNISKQAVNMLGKPQAVNDVREVLDNTAETLRNMRPALANALSGFLGIAGVGATKLPRLGTAIDNVTARFKKWVDSGVESGRIDRMVESAITGFKDLGGIVKNIGSTVGSVFRGLGGEISNPLARIRELTGQVAEFMKTAAAQDGLRALGETLRVIGEQVGRVVMTALRELAPTLVEIAPAAKEVAVAIGDVLVGALETVGPIVRDVAKWLGEHPGAAGAATTAILSLVVAVKALQVGQKVAGWVGAARSAIDLLGRSAKTAGDDVDGLGKKMDGAGRKGGISWGKGFVGGAGLAAAGVGATILLDKLIPKDVSSHGSQAARDMLGGMAATFTGEGASTFQALDVAKWISNPVMLGVEVGKRELMKLFGFTPPPLKVTADAAPAYETVGGWTRAAEGTVGAAKLNANPSGANSAVGAWRGLADGTSATAKLLANSSAGTAVVNTWRNLANGTSGMARLLANSSAGTAVVNTWRNLANGTSATARLLANTGAATSALNAWRNTWSNFTVTVRAVMQRIGFADGGPVLAIPGYASGGPIHGPGGPKSDKVPAMLSAGEHVLTAEDVRNAGGHGGVMALRAMLATGAGSPMTAPAAAALRPPRPATSSGSGDTVVHFSGNTSDALATTVMGLIRTGKIQIKAAA